MSVIVLTRPQAAASRNATRDQETRTTPAKFPARFLPIGSIVRITLGLAILLGAGYAAIGGFAPTNDPAHIQAEIAGLGRSSYAPQKVVYHVDSGGGWRGGAFRDLLGSINNHIKAVGADNIKVAVVLQGSGLDLLSLAKRKPEMAADIDALKAKGVRFLVCKNSLISRGIDPFKDLYAVAKDDVVTAAVAELVELQQEGYVYLHL